MRRSHSELKQLSLMQLMAAENHDKKRLAELRALENKNVAFYDRELYELEQNIYAIEQLYKGGLK
jgi:hypothetical protein